MAVLSPEEKCLILLIKKYFWLVQYAAGYHPGPRADGASLNFYFYWQEQQIPNQFFPMHYLMPKLFKARLMEVIHYPELEYSVKLTLTVTSPMNLLCYR